MTYPRAREYAQAARRALGSASPSSSAGTAASPSGSGGSSSGSDRKWELVNAFGPTDGRPEFRGQYSLQYANATGAVGFAVTNLLLNAICN